MVWVGPWQSVRVDVGLVQLVCIDMEGRTMQYSLAGIWSDKRWCKREGHRIHVLLYKGKAYAVPTEWHKVWKTRLAEIAVPSNQLSEHKGGTPDS
jgi:hypothetical protein